MLTALARSENNLDAKIEYTDIADSSKNGQEKGAKGLFLFVRVVLVLRFQGATFGTKLAEGIKNSAIAQEKRPIPGFL